MILTEHKDTKAQSFFLSVPEEVFVSLCLCVPLYFILNFRISVKQRMELILRIKQCRDGNELF